MLAFFLVLTVNNSTFYKGNKEQRAASTSDNNSLEGDVPVVSLAFSEEEDHMFLCFNKNVKVRVKIENERNAKQGGF